MTIRSTVEAPIELEGVGLADGEGLAAADLLLRAATVPVVVVPLAPELVAPALAISNTVSSIGVLPEEASLVLIVSVAVPSPLLAIVAPLMGKEHELKPLPFASVSVSPVLVTVPPLPTVSGPTSETSAGPEVSVA